MSQATSQKDPRASRIEEIWDSAWAALKKGDVHEHWVDLAGTELSRLRAALPKDDSEASADLSRAEMHHLVNGRLFADSVARLGAFKAWMNSLQETSLQVAVTSDQHITRSVTVAHGALVLGSLALMGETLNRELMMALCLSLLFVRSASF